MKHITIAAALAAVLLTSCGGNGSKSGSEAAESGKADQTLAADTTAAKTTNGYRPDTALTYDVPAGAKIDRNATFIVISKKELRLKVYAAIGADTMLLARYPVCLSRALGQKGGSGDMRTPESPEGKPFSIKQIQDASDWHHDFGDGRGSILSYGHWFMRLETPFNGIGIHGSTGNEDKMPGRDSEGCIRLRDQDIIHLKENYAWVGMPVTIKGEEQGPLPFETRLKNASNAGHKISYPADEAKTSEPAKADEAEKQIAPKADKQAEAKKTEPTDKQIKAPKADKEKQISDPKKAKASKKK